MHHRGIISAVGQGVLWSVARCFVLLGIFLGMVGAATINTSIYSAYSVNGGGAGGLSRITVGDSATAGSSYLNMEVDFDGNGNASYEVNWTVYNDASHREVGIMPMTYPAVLSGPVSWNQGNASDQQQTADANGNWSNTGSSTPTVPAVVLQFITQWEAWRHACPPGLDADAVINSVIPFCDGKSLNDFNAAQLPFTTNRPIPSVDFFIGRTTDPVGYTSACTGSVASVTAPSQLTANFDNRCYDAGYPAPGTSSIEQAALFGYPNGTLQPTTAQVSVNYMAKLATLGQVALISTRSGTWVPNHQAVLTTLLSNYTAFRLLPNGDYIPVSDPSWRAYLDNWAQPNLSAITLTGNIPSCGVPVPYLPMTFNGGVDVILNTRTTLPAHQSYWGIEFLDNPATTKVVFGWLLGDSFVMGSVPFQWNAGTSHSLTWSSMTVTQCEANLHNQYYSPGQLMGWRVVYTNEGSFSAPPGVTQAAEDLLGSYTDWCALNNLTKSSSTFTQFLAAGIPCKDGALSNIPGCRGQAGGCNGADKGASGMISSANRSPSVSWVDNIQMGHIHTATDYQVVDPQGGCSSCGATSGGTGSLPQLSIQRIHRYRDLDRRGSFGPGVFSNYDQNLTLDVSTNTIEFWDPQANFSHDLTDPGHTGTFTDPDYAAFSGLRLVDGTGATTTTMSAAAKALLTTRDGWVYTFEIFCPEAVANQSYAGRLISVADRNGNATTITYQDAANATQAALNYDRQRLWRMNTITDTFGKVATCTYGSHQGLWVISGIALPNGSSLQYQYEIGDLVGLTRIIHPDGSISNFTTMTDSVASLQGVTFDDAGASDIHRRKMVWLSTSSTMQSVNNSTSLTRVPQPPDRVRKVFNGMCELAYQNWLTTLNTQKSIYVYEGGGVNGTGTLMRYDTLDGVPQKVSRATSFDLSKYPSDYTWQVVENYATDANVRITSNTDALSRATTYSYDPHGALTGMVQYQAGGATFAQSSATFNAFAEPLVETDRLTRQTVSTYDTAGNLLTKTVANGTSVQAQWVWTYNGRGQPLTSKDADGNITSYVYNEVAGNVDYKRLISIVEPKDNTTDTTNPTRQFHYDSTGRLATATDQAGRVATYGYDSHNRLTSILYADTSTETWTYGTTAKGTANLIVGHKDRNGNLETFVYDAAGRKVGWTVAPSAGTPIAGRGCWTYLDGKPLVKTETINGDTTTTGYDYLLRAISTTRGTSKGATLISQSSYDEAGRIAASADAYGRRSWSVYDRNDREIRIVRELVPGVLPVPSDTAGRATYLSGLTRVLTANPNYIIEDDAYDVEGQLLARTDGRGIQSTLEYDQQGRLTAQVEASADTKTNPYTLLAYAGRTAFGYDAQGNRTSVLRPLSFTRNMTDGTFTPVSVTYATASTYTGRNLLKSVTEASGTADSATVTYTYSPTGKKASETDARNASWVTSYSYYTCCDRLYQVTDPQSRVTTYTYDANGNVLSVRDPNNVGTDTTYDARNRPLTVKDTLNLTTTYTYDDDLSDPAGLSGSYAAKLAGLSFGGGAAGSAIEVKNPLGETRLEVRDGIGRLVRRVDGNGNYATIVYDVVLANGLVKTTVIDALSHTTESHADAANRIRERVDGESRLSTAGFDPAGNQLSAHDPNNVGWTVADDTTATPGYDGRGRLLKRTDTHGDAASSTYDLDSNVLIATDALIHTTTNTYDYRDRKKTVLDRVSGTTSYTYDANNHLLTIADADSATNGVTTYTYDSRNQLATETFPAGAAGKKTVRTYGYDNGKRLLTRTVTTTPVASPALNEVTTYGYDLANRLTGRTYNDGKGNDTFGYDNANRLTSAAEGRYAVTVARAYTGNSPAEKTGRLTSETIAIGGTNPGTYTTSYQYDSANRVTQITYPTADVVGRGYTNRNQLSSVAFDSASIASRLYDLGGRLQTTTLGNGLVETRGYRSDGSGVDDYLTSLAIPGVTGFAYTADANKRVTAETNSVLPAQNQSFSAYDNENRLTGWSRASGDTQTWTLSKVGDWQTTVINGTSQTRSHDAVHETTNVTGATTQPAYDLKGNLSTNLNGALYTWDLENRLASATVSDATSGSNDTATYRYDALGRRVQKTVYGVVTTFLYDGAQVIDEFDAPVTLASTASTDDGAGSGTDASPILTYAGTTRINFQPSLSPIPPGFYADKGNLYGTRSNGKTYGWDTTSPLTEVARNQLFMLPQYDTFIQFGTTSPSTFGTWKIGGLTAGTYAVVVVMGDCASANQTNDITISGNGVTFTEIDPDPAVVTPPNYQRGDFDGYAETVTVGTDGLIAIAARSTAINPKICFVEIGPLGSSISTADRTNLANAITAANAKTAAAIFPKPQPTPRVYAYGSYVDEPLAIVEGSVKTKYYYVSNHLYSVAAITDSTGAMVERYKYDPYGKQTVMASNGTVSYAPSAYGQFVGFTGRYHDWETGLIYFRNRYFDIGLGRFIERDSAGYIDGTGLYEAYFGQNDLDPSGEACEQISAKIANNNRAMTDVESKIANLKASIARRQGHIDTNDTMPRPPGMGPQPIAGPPGTPNSKDVAGHSLLILMDMESLAAQEANLAVKAAYAARLDAALAACLAREAQRIACEAKKDAEIWKRIKGKGGLLFLGMLILSMPGDTPTRDSIEYNPPPPGE